MQIAGRQAGYLPGDAPMSRALAREHATRRARAGEPNAEAPLVWTFDGPFATCLADMEDTLRRAIVQVGDVSRIAVLIELSLPALRARVAAGDAIQPAWGRFLDAVDVALWAARRAPRAPPQDARAARHAGDRLPELKTCRSRTGSCTR